MSRSNLQRLAVVILFASVVLLLWRSPPYLVPVTSLPVSNATKRVAAPNASRSGTPPAAVLDDARHAEAARATHLLGAFPQWAGRYAAAREADRPALVAEGVRLAAARAEAMAQLIHDDPKAAVAAMLPYHLRMALPPEIAGRIEHPVRGSGELLVLAVCAGSGQTVEEPIVREVKLGEERYKTYTYGRRLDQITTKVTPILGVAVTTRSGEQLLALREAPYEVLDHDEAADLKASGKSGEQTALHIGSKVVWLASPALVAPWLQTADGQMLMEAGGSGSSGGTSTVTPVTHTTGNKKFLAIRVRFTNQAANFEPVSDAVLNSSLQTTVDRFRDWSYGKLQSTYAYTPTLDLPQADSWYYANGQEGKLRTDALAAAAAYDDGTGNHPYASPETNFDFQTVVFTGSVSDLVYAGLASVGGNSMWMRAPESPIIWLHELGHNFGLGHANLWDVTSDSPIGPGALVGYGNMHSVMGGNQSNYGPYNTFERYSIHWLASTDVVTPATNGTYRIYNPDKTSLTAGHPYGMRVAKTASLTYCIEFRPDWTPTADFTADNGALISWTQDDQLLDMTPLSAAGQGDAALLIGRSFNDVAAGVTITPIARGGASRDDYLDVVVNFTSASTNSAPVAVVTASDYAPAVNTAVTLTAIAADPDGDALAYSWDFGDGGNPSVNNSATQTKSWSTAGDYNVRCTVSDMKGKTAVQNLVIHVGTPATFTISGRVTKSDGTPVQDVLIQDANYHIAYTDADGRYTLGALAANSYVLNALHDGWTFTNQFTNPVVLGPSVVNINFTASGSTITPPTMPNIMTVAATDASASETGPDTGTFTITRTGPTTSALSVYFDVVGTATYGSDYQPTGLSAIIPAGSASTTVTITPIDDVIAEPDETVVLQLAQAVTYTLGATTSATVTINDNDAAQVSIVATDATASETGGDTGTFTVTRTGNTASALTVSISITGSATNGTDYPTLTPSVTIPANQSSATLTIAPTNDGVMEVDETVILTLTAGTGYTVGSPSNATVRILAQAGKGGGILREWFDFTGYYYPGGAIGDLVGCSRYPLTTSGSEIVTDVFEAPQSNPGKDYFGERWRAFFIAPVTGNYVFSVAGDNSSELWLSTDATPERKSRICYANSPTGFRNWTAQSSQTSAAIALTAGQRYYIEALFKDYTGSDYMSVGVQYPNGALERPIPANRFDPYTPTSPLPAAWTGTNFSTGPVGSAGVEADFIPASPKHRYSFSGTANAAIADGTSITDSIGGASAAARGAGAVFNANGAGIDLPGGSSTTQAYIDLPNGVITGTYGGGTRYTSATYEAWVTMNTTQSWARIFDFGTSSIGEVGAPGGIFNGTDTHHVALSSNNGTTPYDQRLSRNYPAGTTDVYSDAHSIDSSGTAANGIQYHVVLVYDAVAKNWRWYRNGLLMQTLPDTQGLTTMNDVNNWLGRSMASPDSNLDGIYDEFRIYDYALTEAQIRGNKNAGANKVNTVSDGTFGPLWVSGSAFLSTASTTDTCHFEAQTLTGDFTVQTKLLKLVQNSTSAFGGLMIREGTAATARHAFIGLNSSGISRFIKRTTAAGNASYVDVTGLVLPQWLRLVRAGNAIAAYISADGITWTQEGTTTTYASLPASLQVGLAVSSGSTTTSAMTQFDDFKTTLAATTPTVVVTPSGTATNAGSITFTMTFSESVTGLTASEITVTNGTKGTLSGSGTTYTIPVTPTAQGPVTCQVITSAAQGASGSNIASNIATVSYDTVAPTVVVTPSGTATGVSPIGFTITFSENVTGLTASDITVSNGTKGELSGSGASYVIPITPNGQGAVTCQVISAAAQDAAGNNSTVSNTASITYDTIPPTVTVTSSVTTTSTSPMTFTLTFSEAVSGLTVADIAVTNGGAGTLAGSGTIYTIPVTPGGQGMVTCQVGASAAQDIAGNHNTASNTATATYDSVGPTVTIGAPSVTSTSNGPVTYTVTYADANFSASTLTSGDITLNQTGAANGTLAVTGTGATRTVAISNITGDGTLGISIAAGTASDTLGNLAGTAGPSATFLVSSTGPVVKAATGTDLALGASWTGGAAPTTTQVAAWTSTSLGAGLTLASATAWGGVNVAGAKTAIAISGVGTLTLDAGGIDLSTSTVNLTISNPIELAASQIWNVNAARAVTASGVISGSGVYLTKSGAGSLTLSAANTFDGGLNIQQGTVTATTSTSALGGTGTGTVTLGGVAGQDAKLFGNTSIYTLNNPIILSSTGGNLTIGNSANGTLLYSGTVSGTHDLILANNNNSSLTFTNIDITGAITSSGTGSGGVTITTLGANTSSLTLASTGGAAAGLTITNAVTTSGSLLLTNHSTSGAFTLTGGANNTGNITNTGTSTGGTTITGAITSNVTDVTQNNPNSTLKLSAANAFTGGLYIKAGTVSMGNVTAASTGTIAIGDATTGANAALLSGKDAVIFLNPITVAAGSGTRTIGVNVNSTSGQFGGDITLNHDLIVAAYNGSLNNPRGVNLSGDITGTGNISLESSTNSATWLTTISGASINFTGTIANNNTGTASAVISGNIGPNVTGVIQNSATSLLSLTGINTYTGNTTVNAGTLSISSACLSNESTVTIAAGAFLNLNFSGTNTVAALVLGGVTVPDGTYNSTHPTYGAYFTGSGSLTVVDSIPPTVTISAPSVASTASGPVTYTVTYADTNFSASTLVAGNITLDQTGNANGTVSVTGTGTTRTVTISGITGTGTLGISMGAGTASDMAGNLAGAAGPSGTFVVTTPFEIWINSFPGLSVANRALAADSDGDGINNLLEYALGGNPTIASPAPLPQSNTTSGKLALIFTRTLSTTDLTLTVQATDSPAGPWTDLASSVNAAAMSALLGGVTVLETGGGTTRGVEVRDLYLTNDPVHPRRFMRLQVRK